MPVARFTSRWEDRNKARSLSLADRLLAEIRHLCGAITPRSGDDLEALLGDGTNKQG
jgi:hypothetical protein